MADGLRFRPPRIEVTAVTDWVLFRAFGAGQSDAVQAAVDGAQAVRLAGDLGLTERIGGRMPEAELAREVGQEAARGFSAAAAAGCK